MSDKEPSEVAAFEELEKLVRSLGEELAGFRRRALMAEAQLKETDAGGKDGPVQPKLAERIARLERQNKSLRAKLDAVRSRTKTMLDRVHFLRQQAQGRRER
jgi:predicted  nucleic acid-binding Zn-ribbon protein